MSRVIARLKVEISSKRFRNIFETIEKYFRQKLHEAVPSTLEMKSIITSMDVGGADVAIEVDIFPEERNTKWRNLISSI